MPIEIRELHIRVNVNAPQESLTGSGGSGSAQANRSEEDKHAVIAECVEQVLLVLQAKTER